MYSRLGKRKLRSLLVFSGYIGFSSRMAVAKSNSNTESSFYTSCCYKVANLSGTILDASHTANLYDRYILGEQLGWGSLG